jgi:hypothetical protein
VLNKEVIVTPLLEPGMVFWVVEIANLQFFEQNEQRQSSKRFRKVKLPAAWKAQRRYTNK